MDLQNQVIENPTSAETYNRLGSAYSQLGDYKKAIEAHREAILLSPDKVTDQQLAAFNFLNSLSSKYGLYKEVIEVYKEAVQINPEHPIAYGSLGYAYAALKHYKEAIEAYNQAIRVGPHDGMLYFKLGEAHLALGDKAAAVSTYEMLISVCERQEFKYRECMWQRLAERLLEKIQQ